MLKNKTVIVTGAASGIGAACVTELKKHGATVIGVDRVPIGGKVDRRIEADLTDPRSIVAAVRDVGPGIDGLCNVAGVPPTAPPEEVLAVNALGLMTFTNEMVERLNPGASIVNVSSLAGAGWKGNIAAVRDFVDRATFDNLGEMVQKHGAVAAKSYVFSKEIVCYWTIRESQYFIECGMRMNSVCPGPVETPILDDFIVSFGDRAEAHIALTDRMGQTGDIAPVVAFLVSDSSNWIRGANIPVDGGLHAHLLERSGAAG